MPTPAGANNVTERTRTSVRKLSLSYFFVSLLYLQLNLYGFVAAMIFGVSYSLLPAMAAHQPVIRHPKAAWVRFWLFNAGLLGATVGKGAAAFTQAGALRAFTLLSGALLTVSLLLYGAVMGSTLIAGMAEGRNATRVG